MEKLAIHGGPPVRSVPFRKREPFGGEEMTELREAIESQDLFFTAGNKVAAFEKAFSEKYGARYAVGSTSGTSSVHMASAALNADPGRRSSPPRSRISTVAGIIFQAWCRYSRTGNPALSTWTRRKSRKITDRTRAILVVISGNACDMDAIMAVAAHRLPSSRTVPRPIARHIKESGWIDRRHRRFPCSRAAPARRRRRRDHHQQRGIRPAPGAFPRQGLGELDPLGAKGAILSSA